MVTMFVLAMLMSLLVPVQLLICQPVVGTAPLKLDACACHILTGSTACGVGGTGNRVTALASMIERQGITSGRSHTCQRLDFCQGQSTVINARIIDSALYI